MAVIGNERLTGRWTAAPRLTAVAVLGDVIVDLRDAKVRGEQLSIQATALVGDVYVLVPPGATVEMSGVAVLGRKKFAVEPAEYTLAVPVLRVSAVAILGDVLVATQPPKSRIKSAWAGWKTGTRRTASKPYATWQRHSSDADNASGVALEARNVASAAAGPGAESHDLASIE